MEQPMKANTSSATKNVPVVFVMEFCLWHLRYGAKDQGFTGRMSGWPNLLDALNEIANYNMERIRNGLPKAKVSFHTGLEVGLFQRPGYENNVLANLVNTPDSIPWPILVKWFNDTSRANYRGTPEIGGIPVAAFGREIWGNRGSVCSTEAWVRDIAKKCWIETVQMICEARKYWWGKKAKLLDWNGHNVYADVDECDPNQTVTYADIYRSESWELEFNHLSYVTRELGEKVRLEPKMHHPNFMTVPTARAACQMSTDVNKATGIETGVTPMLEIAHTWGDGRQWEDDLNLLAFHGLLVDSDGELMIHGNAGYLATTNYDELLSNQGYQLGGIAPVPDMDFRWAHCPTNLRTDQKKGLRFIVNNAGNVPESWNHVRKVEVTVAMDVRHAGQGLKNQTVSFNECEADILEAGGKLISLDDQAQ